MRLLSRSFLSYGEKVDCTDCSGKVAKTIRLQHKFCGIASQSKLCYTNWYTKEITLPRSFQLSFVVKPDLRDCSVNKQQIIERYSSLLDGDTLDFLERSVAAIVAAKRKGGKVVVATGSGPNLHEGVTTLIAELMHKGIIDGVLTSSAVIAHEMAGTLDKVKRVDGLALGFTAETLPKGDLS